jgi:purine-nucleoside phosphorylase
MPNSDLFKQIQEATFFIKNRFGSIPKIAVVFGSALAAEFIKKIKEPRVLRYEEIPHFKKTTVAGHGGCLYAGLVQGVPILVADGRFHYYEGHTMQEVVFPVRVFAHLGIEEIILTNAAGALNPRFKSGDLMLVSDHINFTGHNPLRGPNDNRLGPRFVDMINAYDRMMLQKLSKVARRSQIKIQKGVYVGITGPSYETPAEIKMFRKLGGDAIGMSTVPEVIAARHQGVKVAVISCITNLLFGKISPLTHERVVSDAQKIQTKLTRLLEGYLCDQN